MKPAPLRQQLLPGLAMSRVGHAGFGRTRLNALGSFIGTDALSAPPGVYAMRCADSLVGASWSAISAMPGNSGAFLNNDFVSHRLKFILCADKTKDREATTVFVASV